MLKLKYRHYCDNYENIENYQKAAADDFIGWHIHHRLETHNSDGERRLVDITRKELIALDMYYNRPADELIFLTKSEHHSLHSKGESNSMYGKKHTDEAKYKIRTTWDYEKHFTDETKKKMSEAHKGEKNTNYGKHISEEAKKKISAKNKGKRRDDDVKKKISEIHKGRHWYNNGIIEKLCFECPDGFVPGRLN